jgi:hypothetical protein
MRCSQINETINCVIALVNAKEICGLILESTMRTSLTLNEIEERATQFFNTQGYKKLKSEISDYELTYLNGKNINWVLMIIVAGFLLVFGNILWALGGVILVYFISGNNEVLVIIRQETSAIEVTATGNSSQAQTTANSFLLHLPQA